MPQTDLVSADRLSAATPTDMYLDLLARTLTRYESDDVHKPLDPFGRPQWVRSAFGMFDRALRKRNLELVRRVEHDYSQRAIGTDVPIAAETAIGLERIDSLRLAIETILSEGVAGDLLEAGVWSGGASIFMRAVLAVHGNTDRTVWVADSFQGPPPPDLEKYPADADMYLHLVPGMAVSLETVQANFARYGLLDDQVRFLKGWFKDTLYTAPIEKLSLLRLDGDSYEATTQIFDALYDKVSPGGYVVVDDYQRFVECKKATDDFRAARGIAEPVTIVDEDAILWRKTS